METEEITLAIEDSLFDIYSTVENVIEVYITNTYSSFVCPQVDFWELNRSRIKAPGRGKAEEIVETALKRYEKYNSNSIGWFLGPNSTTPRIKDVLENHDFQFKEKVLGMVRPTNEPLEGEDCQYDLRQIDLEYLKNEQFGRMVERAYGMPEGAGNLLYSILLSMQQKTDVFTYGAFDEGKPIANGSLIKITGTSFGLLGGAATDLDYRGQGVYTTMLRKRIDQARDSGMSHVVIQAKEETSAPIASKNGFDTICEMEAWVRES